MPKPRARGGAAAAAAAAGGSSGRSDEEIIKERKKNEAFALADDALFGISWGLWVLAALWFLCFLPAAPESPPSHPLLPADASTGLLICGVLCAGLSRASPQGSWSRWRVAWHLAWCPALAAAALAFYLTSARGRPAPAVPPTSYSLGAALLCALGAAGAGLTVPKFSPSSPKPWGFAWGRLLMFADGALGLTAAFAAVVASGLGQVWGEAVGPAAVACTVMPLAMWSVGTMFCSTDAELVGAMPAAMLQYSAAAAKLAMAGGLPAALPACLGLGLHLALCLPLPLGGETDANPFFMAVWRWYRRWTNLLSEPVSGFGDDD